jgi:hypothetical protein
MKQFYISTMCFKPNWGGDPNQWEGFFIFHTFALESPSFFSPLIHENKIKIGTSLDICVSVNT